MRRRCVTFTCGILLFLAVGSASASGLYSLSFRAGASLATQNWEFDEGPDLDTEYRAGLHLGLSSELTRWQRLRILTELYYSQRGVRGEGFDNRLDYLQVAFMCNYVLGSREGGPYLLAGPRVDIPFQQRLDAEFVGVYDDFEQLEFGADVGAGYELGQLLLELRYSHTFGGSYRSGGLDVQRRAVLLMLGFTIESG